MRKTQYFQMEFKNVEVKEDGSRIFIEGYASTPDVDSYDDIVKPEAFQNTMGSYMQKPIILLQHNLDKIIGKAVDYRIEENGLWIRVELFNDIDGNFKSIQEGLLGAFSIGFRALKWNLYMKDDERMIREITELRLVEVSVVAFPANENARFTLAKSLKSFFDGIQEIKSLATGLAYEIKSDDVEIVNFEEEMKADEIEQIEEKKDEVKDETEKKEEEQPKEEITDTPADVVAEEKEKEEATTENDTKSDESETAGENPDNGQAEEVKSDEVKALESEIVELKSLLLAKDEEIQTLQKSESEAKAKLEAKELEIKEYLSV